MDIRRYISLSLILVLLTAAGCSGAGNVSEPAATPASVNNTEENDDMTDDSLVITANPAIEKDLYWEESILTVYEPKNGGIWYPRMLELENGDLLCAFDTNEDVQNTVVKVVRSKDKGLTWSDAVIATSLPELGCGNPNMIQLDNGEIWLSYRANAETENGYYSSIRVNVSKDNGATWSDHTIVAEELGIGGVYEPHFGMIDDAVAVFYANDSRNVVNEHMQQNIEFKVWKETAWSDKYIASDGTRTGSRDGMPVWDRLEDGRYVLIVEATDEHGYPFVTKIKYSDDGYDWNDPLKTIYIPRMQGKKAGAPYILKMADGRLAVSFHTDEDASGTGDGTSVMKVMTSKDKTGEAWNEPFVPFVVPDGRCASWNAMYSIDNMLYAVTSANYPRAGVYIRRAFVYPPGAAGRNAVDNGSFDTATLLNWRITDGTNSWGYEYGGKKFESKNGSTFLTLISNKYKQRSLSLVQTIPGVEEGLYTLSLSAGGGTENQKFTVSIRQGDSEVTREFTLSGKDFDKYSEKRIKLLEGKAVLTITMPAGEGRILSLDDIELTRNE